MKVFIQYTFLLYIIFFKLFVSEAAELPDMEKYVAETGAQVKAIVQENTRLIEIGAGITGTYLVDKCFATDGIATLTTTIATSYNESLFKKYNGDVLIIIHIIYPEGQGGKKDVLDSTLLYSQRITSLLDPQKTKTTVHFWQVVNHEADQLYFFEHVIEGSNINPAVEFNLPAINLKRAVCSNQKCVIGAYVEDDEDPVINTSFKYNLLDPAGRVFTANSGDIEVLLAIERGPVLAFKFNGGTTIYEAKFTGEKFTGYTSKDDKSPYIPSYIDNGFNYSIHVPVKAIDGKNQVIIKWYAISATVYNDPLSGLKTFKCENCAVDADNSSPEIGVLPLNYTGYAQVFLWEELTTNKIAADKYIYIRDCALTKANVLIYESGTFAGRAVNFIKSAESIYNFSKFVYPSSSAFGTNVVSATVKAQFDFLKANANKLENTVIVTKEKNVITYNGTTLKYEIRTLTPFDKDPATIQLAATSNQVVCIQKADNSYTIQVGNVRKKALSQILLKSEDASALSKIGDFFTAYGQGLIFFGNEYNKAWNEIAKLIEQTTQENLIISLTKYNCVNVDLYYKGNYTKAQYLIFLAESSCMDKVAFPKLPYTVKCAYGMGMWNGVMAIPGDLVQGCAGLSAIFSSEKWSKGSVNVQKFLALPDKTETISNWATSIGSAIYTKVADADACEVSYFNGNLLAIVGAAIAVPEGVADRLVGFALKTAGKFTSLIIRRSGKILKYFTPSNVQILEFGEKYIKIKWNGKDLDVLDETVVDDLSVSLNKSMDEGAIDFDDTGITTTDEELKKKLDALAEGQAIVVARGTAKFAKYTALMKKLDQLDNITPGIKQKFLLDFADAAEVAVDQIGKNPNLVDAWKVLDNAGVDNLIKKNPTALAKVNQYLNNGFKIEANGIVKQADGGEIGKLDMNDPYNPGQLKVKGKYSERHFDPDKAGGPIQNLNWRNADISTNGIKDIKKHLSRFPDSPENTGMIERLKKIENREIQATDYDKRFYTHELTEYQRYKNKGIPDGQDPPGVWDDTHAASLEDYQVKESTSPLYHPSVEQ